VAVDVDRNGCVDRHPFPPRAAFPAARLVARRRASNRKLLAAARERRAASTWTESGGSHSMRAMHRDAGNRASSGSVRTRRDCLRASAALTVAGTSAWLGACDRTATETQATAITFLAALPLTTLTYVPELLADAGGYFADQGLAVSFQSTRGTAQAIQLVLAGSAPLSRIGQIEAMGHIVNTGAPLLNVGTVIKESTVRFVSSASAPLREPNDFLGKVIGIPSQGGESETTLDLLLASAGIEPERVERQVVGVGPGVFNLVEQGRIAAFMVSIDTAIILERQSEGVVVLNPGDFIGSGAQFYMIARDDLEKNREIARKYLQAIEGALGFMIVDDGFDATLAVLRRKYSFATLEDDAVAKDSLREYVRVWTKEGAENVLRTVGESWRRGYEELVSAGRVEAGRDPSQWFTNELVPERA
jgi:ABC-type nitrate/sulfonate/bicarbonate transport system substrate-binding protein